MPSDDFNFIAQRLPEGASFSRNGVEQTTSEAITAALSKNNGSKYLALADLWDVLASAIEFEKEQIGEYSYDKPTALSRATYWREQGAEVVEAGPGSFTVIKATREDRPCPVTDEYSEA